MGEIPLRITYSDLLVIDGDAYRVVEESDREYQLAVPGAFTDTVKTPEELEEMIAEADSFQIHR